MQNPKARQDDIVTQEIFDELVIYDLKRDKVHTLNPTAALVWRYCDGQHSPANLAKLMAEKHETPQGEALVMLTLDRLEKAHLLENKVTSPNGQRLLTRRQVIKMAGLSIALLPVVKSIVAPTAAQAITGQRSRESFTNVTCNSQVCKNKCKELGCADGTPTIACNSTTRMVTCCCTGCRASSAAC